MGGGLLNMVMQGKANDILNSNPSKTFFKATYAKYTNFGLQKFRIETEGQTKLQLSERSTFRFKVPRYADLLMDTYFVITLPNIWSPIYCIRPDASFNDISNCQPYEFKWIKNIGTNLIHRVTYYLNDNKIQEFTGQYLYSMVQRDFSQEKKALFDKMIGNIPELNDPANYSNRNGSYPNASYNGFTKDIWPNGIEPSIREKQLYIPLNIWSTLSSKMALPLVSMQYSTLYIEVECRPIEDLFVIRDIDFFLNWVNDPSFSDPSYNDSRAFPAPFIHADQDIQHNKFYYFLKEPPPGTYAIQANGKENITEYNNYIPIQTDWDANIHLMSTYAFLSDEEVRKFANECQSYLIKEVHEQTLYNLVGSYKKVIDSIGLVASWMWYLQRSDVGERNEWTNYTNWAYENEIPLPITQLSRYSYFNTIFGLLEESATWNDFQVAYPRYAVLLTAIYIIYGGTFPITKSNILGLLVGLEGIIPYPVTLPAECPPEDLSNKLYYTPSSYIENTKLIMLMWGFMLDGNVREKLLRDGLENYIEKYVRTPGNGKDGLYCYNFCLDTDPFNTQPSGAMNLSKFNKVEWEFSTIEPVDASSVSVSITCDASGTPIDPFPPTSADKGYWKTFKYSYNMHIMEERYNMLVCENGVGSLALAR